MWIKLDHILPKLFRVELDIVENWLLNFRSCFLVTKGHNIKKLGIVILNVQIY